MVLAVNPAIEDEKVPIPLPSEVWASFMVGLGDVLQQTPRAVTEAPPVAVTLPPQVAVLSVISETEAVVTDGVVILIA